MTLLLLRCCFSIVLLHAVVSLFAPIPASCGNSGALYFGHLFTSTNGFGVSQVEKAVQLAVEEISAAMPLLSYKLNYTARDTEVSTICRVFRNTGLSESEISGNNLSQISDAPLK